jgi:hypothetical protein
VLRVEAPNLLARNRALHRMLVDGVDVEYTRSDGSIAGAQARVIDFDRPEQNDWLAVNQFTVVEGPQGRRADIVIFVNLPRRVLPAGLRGGVPLRGVRGAEVHPRRLAVGPGRCAALHESAMAPSLPPRG